MSYKVRVVVEKVDTRTGKVVDRDSIAEHKLINPRDITDLGLRHKVQIQILKHLQQYILNEQVAIISNDTGACKYCGGALNKIGYKESNFHAVFTDHKLKVQRNICTLCNKRSIPSIKSIFGTSIHPDLYKLQCEMGSSFSFFKSECQLANLCQENREINNHQRIKQIVNDVGNTLCSINMNDKFVSKDDAIDLIIQIDGGHIKDKSPDKRSFEALTAKIYKPEAVVNTSKDRTEIKDSTCVASAKMDRNKTIQSLIDTAARKQGWGTNTRLTIIADGAKNCWNATKVIASKSSTVVQILDWFHIAKEFQPLLNQLYGEDKEIIESIKWSVWHCKKEEIFNKLQVAIKYFEDQETKAKLKKIRRYLAENEEYLVNYADRKSQGLIFTSHVAESTVEHLINERHKRKQKMQWTRESAHNVLQIRAAIFSKEWNNTWEAAVKMCIGKAA